MDKTIHGTWRDDGTFIGFDYVHQHWYDTSETCGRDRSRPAGSAANPIEFISARDNIIPD